MTLSQQNSQSGAELGASMDVVANFGVAEGGYHRPRVCALSSRLRPLYRPIPIDECSEDLLSDGWRLYGQLRRQMASSRPVRLSLFNRGFPTIYTKLKRACRTCRRGAPTRVMPLPL